LLAGFVEAARILGGQFSARRRIHFISRQKFFRGAISTVIENPSTRNSLFAIDSPRVAC
jgi:hypothetical protein